MPRGGRGSLVDIERFIRIPFYYSTPVVASGKDARGNWNAYTTPVERKCFLRPAGWRKRYFHGQEMDEEGQIVTFEKIAQGDRIWLPGDDPTDMDKVFYPQVTSPVYDEYGRIAYYVTRL